MLLISRNESRSTLLTLAVFQSPLPNPKLWHAQTIGHLQRPECFVNGGWWHDARILAATGQGLEKEEPRAWEGWWNEHIVCEMINNLANAITANFSSGFPGRAHYATKGCLECASNRTVRERICRAHQKDSSQ